MPMVFRLILLVLVLLLLPSALVDRSFAFAPQQANTRGVALMREGEYALALEPLLQAYQALPYNAVIRRNLAECYLGLGVQHLEARRFAEAEKALWTGKAYADDDARFWLYRGYALLLQGDHGEAEGELLEALALDEENPKGHQLLGQLYYETGRLRQAIESWQRTLELTPENAEVASLLKKARRELPVETSMTRDYGRNFTISYDGRAQGEVGSQVLEVLEDAYREIGYDLNYYPETQVPVLLYADRDFAELTDSPDWAGGLYDGKIRIPIGGVTGMNKKLRALLCHEYVHVAVRFLARGRCPVWFNEGLAEIAERRHHDPPLKILADAAREEKLLPFGRLEKSFAGLSREEAVLAYEQAYSMVKYLVEEYQWYKVTDLLVALGQGDSMAEAVERVLGEYGLTYASLQEAWRGRLGATH
jgi:tetratricopeptide (TPR) repeat protein